jgi:hypothetical protein
LARRMVLMLGLPVAKHASHATPSATPSATPTLQLGASLKALGLEAEAALSQDPASSAWPQEGLQALPPKPGSPPQAGSRLPVFSWALVRCAADRRRWFWHSGSGHLWVRAEAADQGWCLGKAANFAAARTTANPLYAALMTLHHASEQLVVVDHVLLRPQSSHAAPSMPADFFNLRVSVLLPGWGPRTAQEGFRAFANETLRHNCPAHLGGQCLWLNPRQWLLFETLHAQWLQALQSFAQADSPSARATLDAASSAVLGLMRQVGA